MSDPAPVRDMTDQEYERWREAKLVSYTQEMVDFGMLPLESARARSVEQHAEHLPQERSTPRMHLLRVLDGNGKSAGTLWMGPHPRKPGAGFVYDVAIDEARRGEGHGRAAMLAVRERAPSSAAICSVPPGKNRAEVW